MMRIFYEDEGPIDTLLQIAAGPVRDGDLVSKPCRDAFVKHGWVAQCHGFNVVTPVGENAVRLLGLKRSRPKDAEALPMTATAPLPWAEGPGLVVGDHESERHTSDSVRPGSEVTWSSSGNWRYRVLAVFDGHAWIWCKGIYGAGKLVSIGELKVVS